MRLSIGLTALLLAAAPAVLAQNNNNNNNNSNQNNNQPAATSQGNNQNNNQPAATSAANKPNDDNNKPQATSAKASAQSTPSKQAVISIPGTTSTPSAASPVSAPAGIVLSGLPTFAGVGIPDMKVPNTNAAPFMHRSDLPDGTVFICVGAILAFCGAAVLAWRGLVAWSLHRSVKRAAMAQNMADMKAMTAVPGKKRGMYNVVGANSTMSLDHLHAAPIGNSKVAKPFAAPNGGTPPASQTSLFFSPTAGGPPGMRNSVVNRSSSYLPAGYYASGNAAPASGSPVTHVGGHGANLSVHSLANQNRFSARSGISPPHSPALPPSRGNDRSPQSRDGYPAYNRNSITTIGNSRSPVYGQGMENMSQISLNVPGGNTAGGRAPSAYLEDLFENHGTGSRERF